MRRVLIIRLGGVLAAASLLASAAGGSSVAATTAAIALKPAVGPPTTRVQVDGSGFGAGETVAISFDRSLLAPTVADAAGAFRIRVTVPASAHPGSHVIEADGQASGLAAQKVFLVRTDWVQRCFEAGRSCFNPYENVIGLRTASLLAKSWAARIGASGTGSPVYQGGVLYAGGSDGLHGLDPATGAIIINFRIGPVTTTPAVIPRSGRSAAEIVVGSTDGTFAAASKTGGLMWRVALGAPVTSPLLACFPPDPCKVIVGAGHVLYAFDRNGNRQWAAVLEGGDISKGGAVIINQASGQVAVAAGNSLYAVNASDGSVVWSKVLSRSALGDPAVGNRKLVRSPQMLVGDRGGTLYLVNPGTGVVVSRFAAGGAISGSPAIGDPNLSDPWEFVGDSRGDLYGFKDPAQLGRPTWAANLGGSVNGSPVLANGVLYVGTDPTIGDPNLFALDAGTGRVLFETTLPGGMASAAMVADGKVVLALASGDIAGYETPDT